MDDDRMRLTVLDRARLEAVERLAEALASQGTLCDATLARSLDRSIDQARYWRRRLARAGRWRPSWPWPRRGRPATRPGSAHARRVARLREGRLSTTEQRAVTIAAKLALAHAGTVPIGPLAEALGVGRSRAGQIYSGLRVAGLCPWPGRGWTAADDDPEVDPAPGSS